MLAGPRWFTPSCEVYFIAHGISQVLDHARLTYWAAPATADPSIATAIAALVAHMDGIHKYLVERIGQVHERVDRIA
ncbi:hypothetical protein Acr_00g0099870 [Actinidia rufa]|uniref:Uncharacterized protein n=1 Tax=Actinidia rufa TaxID=165716 RepID=A0A7J0E0B4_9ERIC|nr:hypothetical protein Acr_00g0099870 [Actinidia rufa]